MNYLYDFLIISSNFSRSRFSGTLATISPFLNTRPSFTPPAIPKSACLASPGPFTAQPIVAMVIGYGKSLNLSSTFFASEIKSICVLPQVGQDTKLTPLSLRLRLFRISKPALTSSTGFSVSETLMVSPIPSAKSVPSPTEDFINPPLNVPASVTPKCSG